MEAPPVKVETLAHVKNQFSSVLDHLGKEPLLITRNGKVAAVLQALADDEVEDYLLRNSPRFWELIAARRDQVRRGAVIPFTPDRYTVSAPTAAGVREKPTRYKARRPR
jgi:PHD/YefM family antitoxin component YafN of YafNO toxin-antitoxin module